MSVPGEGESIAVALVNTRYHARSGVVDHIATAGTAAAWLRNQGLVTTRPVLGQSDFGQLIDLRRLAFKALSARIGGVTPPAGVVAALNRYAQSVPVAPRLSWAAATLPTLNWQTVGGTAVERALAAVAQDVAATVSGSRGERLLQCQAQGCVRLLLKDRPQRLWCSTRCGDRVRSARHYSRRRTQPHS